MKNKILIEEISVQELTDSIERIVKDSENRILERVAEIRPLLSRKEVCKSLGISYPTLSNMDKNGILKGIRVKTKVMYEPDDIKEFKIKQRIYQNDKGWKNL